MTLATNKSILIPVDGRPCSDKALDEGVKLAKTLGASVMFIHIMENPVVLYGAGDAVAYQDDLYHDLREQARHILERAKKLASQLGINAQTLLFESNRPADVILEEHCRHDLIVMGTHGRKGMSRWVIGSVAESVLRRAKKPCLIVHSKA